MTKKTTNSVVGRRGAMLAAASVAGGTLVATAGKAEAATGQAVIQGAANNAGAGATSLTSASANPTLSVKNTGSGAGALFQAVNSNGFAGGTFHGGSYGLSAANSGTAGVGAALAASGINNTGILTNTNNGDKYAVLAMNKSAQIQSAGAVLADGGVNAGLVAAGEPAVLAIGDVVVFGGAEVVSVPSSELAPELYAGWSTSPATVTISGKATLDAQGTVTITPQPGWAALDLATARSLVSANSGPMPNLWISVNTTDKTVRVEGGTASGTVSWQVTATRAGTVQTIAPVEAQKLRARATKAAAAVETADPTGR